MPKEKRTPEQVLAIYDRHADTVYRVCRAYLRNAQEAEDMTQETFVKLLTSAPAFENERHEKAWLIVTASNLCKDDLKKWWRKTEDIEDHLQLAQPERETDQTVLNAILTLPRDYKVTVYMYYYEGYTTVEIARHMRCPEATVRSRLARGRKLLGNLLGGEEA